MFWDPFDEIERMHREMDNIFSRAFGGSNLIGYDKGENKSLAKRERLRAPMCDVKETETGVIANFELPGAEKKDIELNITDDSIEVKVERKDEKKTEKDGEYNYAMRSSRFYRRVPLPAEVESDKAKASYKNGMLRIEIPKSKKESGKKKRIEID